MGYADYSGSAPQHSVLEVLKIASAELLELRARYETVSHRIRALRTAVDVLCKLEDKALVAKDFQRVDVSGSRNPDLRRACRIALLEASDAVSEQDIYRRIVRRGSFHFVNIARAASSIEEELDALADLGEVRRFDSPEGQLWQRIPPRSDQQDAPVS